MSGNKDKLIAFNYFGGKFTWLEYLYKYFPDNFTHLVDLLKLQRSLLYLHLTHWRF